MGIIGRLRHSSWLSGADSPAGKMPQVQRQRQILTASRGRQRKLTDSEAENSGSLSNKSVQSRALGPRCKKSSVAPLWCRHAIPLYRKLQSTGMKTRSCSASWITTNSLFRLPVSVSSSGSTQLTQPPPAAALRWRDPGPHLSSAVRLSL